MIYISVANLTCKNQRTRICHLPYPQVQFFVASQVYLHLTRCPCGPHARYVIER